MTAPKGYVDTDYLDALTVLTQAAKQRSHALLGLHAEVFPLLTTSLPVAQRILGFQGIEQLALDLGRVTPAELAHWRAELAAADADGTFYFCLNLVLVAGMVG